MSDPVPRDGHSSVPLQPPLPAAASEDSPADGAQSAPCRSTFPPEPRLAPVVTPGGPEREDEPPPDAPGDTSGDGRRPPERVDVPVTPAEYRTNEAAAEALARVPGLYQRGELLVRVVPGPAGRSPPPGGLRPTRARLFTHDVHTLRDEMTRVVRFVQEKPKGPDGESRFVAVHVPTWCPRTVIARRYWPGVPELTALVEYPVLLPGGRVLVRPGYDSATGLFLAGDFRGLAIPAHPTHADAVRAAATLTDLVCDFPFESPAHRAAWVCALLTPLARYAYEGPTPLFLFDKNVRGAGGSLLADLVATVVTGADFARTTYSADPGEVRKIITSFVMAGDPLVLFDNVTGPFGDPALAAALTGVRWKDRVLGSSRTYDGPLTTVFYASGNNCELVHDAPRRVLPCRLESREEHPEDRTRFKYALPTWARDHRSRYLAAALTVLVAAERAGRPGAAPPLKPWGSFGGWSDRVRSAVVWAGLDDPLAGKDQLREESDRDARTMASLLEALEPWQPARGFTAREVVTRVQEDGWEVVAECLTMLEATTTPQLGYRLRHFKGRVFGDRLLAAAGPKGNAGLRWRVQKLAAGDFAGEVSSPSSRLSPCAGGGTNAGQAPAHDRHDPVANRKT